MAYFDEFWSPMFKRTLLALVIVSSVALCNAQLPELKILSTDKAATSEETMLARKYFTTGDYKKAEELYFKSLETTSFRVEDYLFFANTLLANEKPSLANEFYKEYASHKEDDNLTYRINQIFNTKEHQHKIDHESTLPEFSNPGFFAGSLFLGAKKSIKKYLVDCDGTLNLAYEILDVPTGYIIGTASFFDQENQAVVSLIHIASNKSSLYYYTKKKGEWRKPEKLFDSEYNSAFPHIDEKNNALYFASDRNDGLGGYDIYVSSFNKGDFSKPINLGERINTTQNDISPTIIDNWLYFSSNGKVSHGGYDIYRYKSIGDYAYTIENCLDLNTNKDDFGVFGFNQDKITAKTIIDGTIHLKTYTASTVQSRFVGSVTNLNKEPLTKVSILIPMNNSYVQTGPEGNFEFMTENNISSLNIKVLNENHFFLDTVIKAGIINELILKPAQNKQKVKLKKSNTIASTENSLQTTKSIDSTLYYVILESTYDYSEAYVLWNKWVETFSNVEIYSYQNGLYRIGIATGKTEENALSLYRTVRDIKTDIWILRPTIK